MDSKLRDLLDKIYELEGLVHLTLKRDVSSKDFLRLISKKGKEIGEVCSQLNFIPSESEEPCPVPPVSEVFALEEYSIDEESENPEELSNLSVEKDSEIKLPENASYRENQRGKLVFSINDRFRFRKELFGNSDVDFNNTLALVASMDDYEEAEDYFLNEVNFDKTNPVVGEFLNVIKRYFQ